MMGVNYYKILQVDRKANDDDLKRAYRKLAMKWHPDKNPNNQRTAEAKMKKISEAYSVLSDPQRRVEYDQQERDGGLKGQTPLASGASCSDRTTGHGRTMYGFNSKSANDIYSDFRAMGHMGANPRAAVYGISSGVYSGDMSMYGSLGRGAASPPTYSYMRKSAAVERTLRLSLEDLYMGTAKKTKITWDAVDDIGRPTKAEEITTIDIKPGWRKGTKITFQGLGNEQSIAIQNSFEGLRNQQSRAIPSELVLTIDEIPHRVFKRDGNDLIATLNISLVEALTGYTVNLTTLDRRNLIIPIDSIIGPSYEEVVRGEGMPILYEPSSYGDLRIKFNITFPIQLTPDQKMNILPLLTSS